MPTLVDIEQNTSEWLEFRKNKIGASDAAVILGISPWKTRFQLWEEKLGLKEKGPETKSMRYGKEMEEEARNVFEFETGFSVNPKVFIHSEYDHIIASLDGIDTSGKCIVEIKCPGPIDHGIALDGEIPKKYYPQLQHQMAVVGVDKMYYFSYNRSNYKIIEVKRDDEYISHLLVEENHFWEKIINRNAPELCDRDFQERIDDQWHEAVHKWKHAKNQMEMWKQQEEEARKFLIVLSGGSNARGGGIKLSKTIRKGPINYPEIPELSAVNLEKYRKAPVEFWSILEC